MDKKTLIPILKRAECNKLYSNDIEKVYRDYCEEYYPGKYNANDYRMLTQLTEFTPLFYSLFDSILTKYEEIFKIVRLYSTYGNLIHIY